jgi:hypothetical protein
MIVYVDYPCRQQTHYVTAIGSIGAGAQYCADTKFPHSFDPHCHDEACATEGPWRDNARAEGPSSPETV